MTPQVQEEQEGRSRACSWASPHSVMGCLRTEGPRDNNPRPRSGVLEGSWAFLPLLPWGPGTTLTQSLKVWVPPLSALCPAPTDHGHQGGERDTDCHAQGHVSILRARPILGALFASGGDAGVLMTRFCRGRPVGWARSPSHFTDWPPGVRARQRGWAGWRGG